MQQPIRYYITKSGEEPVVRSVKVARASAHASERTETAHKPPAPEARPDTPHEGVKQLVRGAIRKRISLV